MTRAAYMRPVTRSRFVLVEHCFLSVAIVTESLTLPQTTPMDVIVLPHDPRWSKMFEAESKSVMRVLGQNALDAHHIGSTAIKSIAAKPVIDILIVVADIAEVDACNTDLMKLGYEAMGECGIPDRRYFRKESYPGKRTHNIHVFPHGSDHIRRHLAFRDFINAHPEWAGRYSTLKSKLADQYPDSIEDYMEGKDAFIKHVDTLAANWQTGIAGEQWHAPKSATGPPADGGAPHRPGDAGR